MYGILRNKDLDQKLGDLLDEKSLKALNCVNRYYTGILNDEYYKRRFRREVRNDISNMNIKNESWQKFYFLVKKYLTDEDHVNSVRLLILADQADILELLYEKHNCYKNTDTIYGWQNKTRGYTNPLSLSIEHDRVKCFQYLSKLQPSNINVAWMIHSHAHKILKVHEPMLSKEDKALNFLYSCEGNCMACSELLNMSDVFPHKILAVLYNSDSFSVDYFTYRHSLPLQKYMNSIPRNDLLFYKEEALQRNRMEIVQLLNCYTSPFSKFKEHEI